MRLWCDGEEMDDDDLTRRWEQSVDVVRGKASQRDDEGNREVGGSDGATDTPPSVSCDGNVTDVIMASVMVR